MDGMIPQAIAPWRPPRWTPEQAALGARLARPCAPWVLAGGVRVELRPVTDDAGGPVLRIDTTEGPVLVQAPDTVFDTLLRALDAAASGSRGAVGALLLEAALEPALPSAELVFGPLSIAGLEPAEPASWTLGLLLTLPDGSTGTGRLALPERLAARLLAARDAMPTVPASVGGLRVPVSIRLAMAELSLGVLRGLAPGDAVVPDVAAPLHVVVIAGEAHAWRAACAAPGVVSSGPRARAAALGLQEWTMEQTALPADAASLDDLPVRLAFELGRVEMTVGELAAVGAGHVIPLSLDPRQGPVDILANGRRIGRGEIIEVNGALAVRILSLAIA